MGLLVPCLTSLDLIDAALAALTADAFREHQTHAFGNGLKEKFTFPQKTIFQNRS